MVSIPAELQDLLTRPLYGHLATSRPDGTLHVNRPALAVAFEVLLTLLQGGARR
jgi:hypothetical protein